MSIVTVPEAKAFLNINGGQYDNEISDMLEAGTAMISNRIGPVATAQPFNEWYDGGGPFIALRHTPVQTVVSITEAWGGGTVYALTLADLTGGADTSGNFGYSLDSTTGLLTRRMAGTTAGFSGGFQNINVQYTAGYAVAPPELRLAANLLLRHMWETQRGGSRRPGMGGDDSGPGSDFDALPSRVEEILESYYLPGIA